MVLTDVDEQVERCNRCFCSLWVRQATDWVPRDGDQGSQWALVDLLRQRAGRRLHQHERVLGVACLRRFFRPNLCKNREEIEDAFEQANACAKMGMDQLQTLQMLVLSLFYKSNNVQNIIQ